MPLELMRGRAWTATTPAAARSTAPASSFERFTSSVVIGLLLSPAWRITGNAHIGRKDDRESVDRVTRAMMGDMRTTLYVVPASIVLLVLAPSASTADDFKLTCTLPFDPIATKPDPFLTCGNDGSGKNGAPLSAAKIRQANAKNNFCADMSNPVTVTFQILA